MDNYFARLNQINVNDHVERKGQFSYLSWPYAVAQLRLADPTAAKLRRACSVPLWKVGPTQIAAFSEAVRAVLFSTDSPAAKNYLRVLVSEIRVSTDKATITGSPAALAEAASKWKPDTKGMVPSFVSEWRARQESNL